jgi:hypothetical protein
MAYHPSPKPRGMYKTVDFTSQWHIYRLFDEDGECFSEWKVRPDKDGDDAERMERERLDVLCPVPLLRLAGLVAMWAPGLASLVLVA